MSHSTVCCTSRALSWDSNPNVLKDPATQAPHFQGRATLLSQRPARLVAPAWSSVLGVAICLLPTTLKETALSDCSSQLVLQSPRLWLPSSPGTCTWPQAQWRGFSLVQIQSYTSTASLSLPFVSPQKGIPPLHAYAAHFIFPSWQSRIMHLQLTRLFPWASGDVSVTLQLRLLEFQVLCPQHCCV